MAIYVYMLYFLCHFQLLVQNRGIVTMALYFPSSQYTSSFENYQSDIQKKLISDEPKHLKFHLKECCIGSCLEMFRNQVSLDRQFIFLMTFLHTSFDYYLQRNAGTLTGRQGIKGLFFLVNYNCE